MNTRASGEIPAEEQRIPALPLEIPAEEQRIPALPGKIPAEDQQTPALLNYSSLSSFGAAL